MIRLTQLILKENVSIVHEKLDEPDIIYLVLVIDEDVETDLYKRLRGVSPIDNKHIVGMLTVNKGKEQCGNDQYCISNLYVDKSQRRKKIATKLFDYVRSVLRIEPKAEIVTTDAGEEFVNKYRTFSEIIKKYDDMDVAEKDLYNALIKIHSRLQNKKILGQGRNRVAYDNGDDVLKVPLNVQGCYDNESEYKQYTSGDSHLAKCTIEKIYVSNSKWKVPVLHMEKVDTNLTLAEKPDWADFIDCYQVGRTKDGHIVAYDYAWCPRGQARDEQLLINLEKIRVSKDIQ